MRLCRGETVPRLPPQTREFAARCLASDHLRRPRGAPERFRALAPMRKLERFAAGAQIITGRELIAAGAVNALMQSRCSTAARGALANNSRRQWCKRLKSSNTEFRSSILM